MQRLHGTVIVTYRCNARCNMCNVWQNPTNPGEEITPGILEKLPQMSFTNITGGEPFIRNDLNEIVAILKRKTQRIVISTNGYFTEKIIQLFKMHPKLGIRISIEGTAQTNDTIRHITEGFNKTLATLSQLREMGIKDIGFAMTIQDLNAKDLIPLYKLAKGYGYEFATAAVHNSHYFHKWDNSIKNKEEVIKEIKELIALMLRANNIKEWFRAYFNYGLINYIRGNTRFIPCEMGKHGFFIDPWANVLACNGMDAAQAMGNLNSQTWEQIWSSRRAQEIRTMVKNCKKECWMIGSASPAMRHHPLRPIMWIAKNKILILLRGAPVVDK